MTRSKIAILMSTYNGAQYLKEQIESIQQQTNHDWQLYIRDDGSKDQTVDIAQSYAQRDPRINLVDQESSNRGVIGSFMRLLKLVDADYYMFADQDDYWLPEKVDNALEAMEKAGDNRQPICVHTELQVTDAKLHKLSLMKNGQVWTDFPHFMFGNCITGCTMMINQALKQKIDFDHLNLDHVLMHDWWIGLIASAFGKVVYDSRPAIYYRQHADNVVGDEHQSMLTLIERAFRLDKEAEGFSQMLQQIKEFSYQYGDLDGNSGAYLRAYAELSSDSNRKEIITLIRHYPPRRLHRRGEVMLSYLLLFGKHRLFD